MRRNVAKGHAPAGWGHELNFGKTDATWPQGVAAFRRDAVKRSATLGHPLPHHVVARFLLLGAHRGQGTELGAKGGIPVGALVVLERAPAR